MNAERGRPSIPRTLLAGLAGGAAMNAAMLLMFRLIGMGWDGDGFLLDPAIQSPKLIAVWAEIEPLPRVVNDPVPMAVGVVVFAVVHALVLRWVSPAWPQGVWARAWRMALLVWLLVFVFWEFFTPFNLFGEPVWLVGIEVSFWGVIALAESLAIAAVMEAKRGEEGGLTSVRGGSPHPPRES